MAITPDNVLPNQTFIPNKPQVMKVSNAETENAILQIDRQLFRECIKIARFNIHFRLEANYHSSQRDWRYPLGQEAGTAGVFANAIVSLNQYAKGLSNLKKISKSSQRKGLCAALVGYTIRGTSSAIELGENELVHLKAKKNGFSPHDSVLFLKARLQDTEKLLAQREQLVNLLDSDREQKLFRLHDVIFRQILQQLLLQFIKWSINSREVAWREDTFYALNTAQNFILSTSSILSLQAFNNPQARSSAIITGLLGNSLATLTPPARTLVGVCMRKYQRHQLLATFAQYRQNSIPEWQTKWQNLKDTIPEEHSAAIEDAIAELSFLANDAKKLDDILDAETARIQKLRRVAAQQAISGPLIGLTSLSRSILSAVAHYDYPQEPKVRNQLHFAGTIPQVVGQGYSLINTPTAAILNARYKKNLAKRGELPAQLLKKRLQSLDVLEAQLQAAHPWSH